MQSTATAALLQQKATLDDCQDLANEVSKESTVVDMDEAAAHAHKDVEDVGVAMPQASVLLPVFTNFTRIQKVSVAGLSSKAAGYDIDDLASRNQMTDAEKKLARTAALKEKRERLERFEQRALSNMYDTPTSCLQCSSVDAGEEFVVGGECNASKWA